jgi:hypothetical protein
VLLRTNIKSGTMSSTAQGIFLPFHSHKHYYNVTPEVCSTNCDTDSDCVGMIYQIDPQMCVHVGYFTGLPQCNTGYQFAVKC